MFGVISFVRWLITVTANSNSSFRTADLNPVITDERLFALSVNRTAL